MRKAPIYLTFDFSFSKITVLKSVTEIVTSSLKGILMEKIRLKLKAYDHRVLDRSVAAFVEAVKRTGA